MMQYQKLSDKQLFSRLEILKREKRKLQSPYYAVQDQLDKVKKEIYKRGLTCQE